MTIKMKAFERYIQLYGPNFLNWPDSDFKDVESFLEKNDKAQEILKEAQRLSSALDSYHVPDTRADLSALALEKIDQSSKRMHRNHNVFQISTSHDRYYVSALRWVAVASFIVLLCGSIVWSVQDNNPLGLNQDVVIANGNQASDSLDSALEDLIADEMEIEESMQLLAMLEEDESTPSQPGISVQEHKDDVLIEEYLEEWEDQELEGSQDIWEFFMEENSQQGYKHDQNRKYS